MTDLTKKLERDGADALVRKTYVKPLLLSVDEQQADGKTAPDTVEGPFDSYGAS